MAGETRRMDEEWIGNFRFLKTIHQGQNTTLMEVQDRSGRKFALKQLLPADKVEAAERKAFEFEAKLGMELRHPNLIKIFEFVKDKQQPYFVMEYFPSWYNLRLAIAKREAYPIAQGKLHWIIEQTATALAYMHDKGWIHRDVKPENIIVNRTGEARVIDYGLAKKPFTGFQKMLGAKAPRQGTLSYLSPEQIRCESPAISADVYSFGITCYELACGRQPFRANSPGDLLSKHMHDIPSPPTVHNKNITQEYSDLMIKMLKKKPAERIADLHEFRSRFSRIRVFKDDPDPQADRI